MYAIFPPFKRDSSRCYEGFGGSQEDLRLKITNLHCLEIPVTPLCVKPYSNNEDHSQKGI